MSRLARPEAISSMAAVDRSSGITMNKATKRTAPKLANVTRARLRTSELAITTRSCYDKPTNRRPTSVAEAVPARM